jgi:hypothetical protein
VYGAGGDDLPRRHPDQPAVNGSGGAGLIAEPSGPAPFDAFLPLHRRPEAPAESGSGMNPPAAAPAQPAAAPGWTLPGVPGGSPGRSAQGDGTDSPPGPVSSPGAAAPPGPVTPQGPVPPMKPAASPRPEQAPDSPWASAPPTGAMPPAPGDARGRGSAETPDEVGEVNELPRRVKQASLAPQLRADPPRRRTIVASGGTATGGPAGGPTPADIRRTMSALQRGWQDGRSQQSVPPGDGPVPTFTPAGPGTPAAPPATGRPDMPAGSSGAGDPTADTEAEGTDDAT